MEELAAAEAATSLAEITEADGRKLVVRTFADRDLNFVKLFAQKLTRLTPNAVALLATTSPQLALVFAQSAGQPHDMGALMKETLARFGGRGGGSKDMAQGGLAGPSHVDGALAHAKLMLNT
jgi:alanyl-tRNA synthetase